MATYKNIYDHHVCQDVAELLRKAGCKEKGGDNNENTTPTIEQALRFLHDDVGMVIGCDFGGRATIPNRVSGYNSVIRFCLTEYLKKK